MMKNRILTLVALLALLCAVPATAGAGTFWHDGTTTIRRSAGSTECPAGQGWVRLTPAEVAAVAGVPPRYVKSVGGKPVEMDAGEKAAVDLARTRANARSRLLSAVTELLASQEVKARLNAAGKDETKIDARIAVLDTAISTALGNHP